MSLASLGLVGASKAGIRQGTRERSIVDPLALKSHYSIMGSLMELIVCLTGHYGYDIYNNLH